MSTTTKKHARVCLNGMLWESRIEMFGSLSMESVSKAPPWLSTKQQQCKNLKRIVAVCQYEPSIAKANVLSCTCCVLRGWANCGDVSMRVYLCVRGVTLMSMNTNTRKPSCDCFEWILWNYEAKLLVRRQRNKPPKRRIGCQPNDSKIWDANAVMQDVNVNHP